MASPNSTFTELVTTTLRHTPREIADNVTDHNALLTLMKRRGNIKTDASGGYEIQVPLSYAENSTYQRFTGYDTLNIGASDVLSSAKYDWKQVAIHVTASGRELRINRSKERMINLVKARKDVAKSTAANNLSIDIYSDGALSNQIGGLAHLIQSGGAGTVGGINATTYTFWGNGTQELTAPGTFSTLKKEMMDLWLTLNRGTDKPDLIVLTHDLYSTYVNGLQDLQRYASANMAKLGFEALKFSTADVVFDDNSNFGTTSETGYFLNTKYLWLYMHPDAQFTPDDAKTPINQDAVVIPMYAMLQMCCSNRSLQGRIHDLA